MNSRGKTRVALALLCAVLFADALAAPATTPADPGVTSAKVKGKKMNGKSPAITTVTAAGTTTADQQLLSLIPTCPKRTTLVGGGFSSGLPTSPISLDLHLIYESRRLSQRKWIVSAARSDADMSGTPLALVAHAQCRATQKAGEKRRKGNRSDGVAARKKKKVRVRQAATSVPLLPGFLTSATTTASCPARTNAVGGGFSLSPAPTATVNPIDIGFSFESRRSFVKGWTTSAAQFSPNQRTLTAFAYCLPGKAPKQRSSTAFLSGIPLSTAAVNPPRCLPRLSLTSGGFLAPVPSQAGGAGTFLTSAPSGKEWRLLAVQTGEGTGGPVSGFAYCL